MLLDIATYNNPKLLGTTTGTNNIRQIETSSLMPLKDATLLVRGTVLLVVIQVR